MNISQSLVKMLFSCRKQIKRVMDYSVCDVDEIFSIRNPDFVLVQDILGSELITFNDFSTLSKDRDDEPVLDFLQQFHDNLESGHIIIPNPNKIMVENVGEMIIRQFEDRSLNLSYQGKLLAVHKMGDKPLNAYQLLIEQHIKELI